LGFYCTDTIEIAKEWDVDNKTIAGKSDVELAYEVLERTGEIVRNKAIR